MILAQEKELQESEKINAQVHEIFRIQFFNIVVMMEYQIRFLVNEPHVSLNGDANPPEMPGNHVVFFGHISIVPHGIIMHERHEIG